MNGAAYGLPLILGLTLVDPMLENSVVQVFRLRRLSSVVIYPH